MVTEIKSIVPEATEVQALLKKLRQKVTTKEFDAEFLPLTEKLRQIAPWCVEGDIFALEYYLNADEPQKALPFAESAYRRRKSDLALTEKLARIHGKLGNSREMLLYAGIVLALAGGNLKINYSEEVRFWLSVGSSIRMMPFMREMEFKDGAFYFKGGRREFGDSVIMPPGIYPQAKPYNGLFYFLGAYNENKVQSRSGILWQLMREKNLSQHFYCHLSFDLMRAELHNDCEVPLTGAAEQVIPLAATVPDQKITIDDGNDVATFSPGLYEFNFYRVKRPVKISSEQSFAMGRPVKLEHNPQRKKLVLNILLDGLSWGLMKRRNYEDIPNIMEFFRQGIIFDNHYTTGEWTIAAVGSIETGVYAHQSQIFHPDTYAYLDDDYVTISEQMNKLGYYCVSPAGNSYGIWHGELRGIDRHIFNWYTDPDSVGVERTIRYLQAFGECDNYVYVHLFEPHPFKAMNAMPEAMQTTIPFARRFPAPEHIKSVWREPNEFDQAEEIYSIQAVDRALGGLFRYIRSRYREDEYVVHLYSDHGVSTFERETWLFTEDHAHAALMMRGANIPPVGLVGEMTSGVDIYKIVGHNCGFPVEAKYLEGNLPAIFGGKEREYAYSQAIFPGQTYKLDIRSKEAEFRLESRELTNFNGTVNLTGCKHSLHPLNRGQEKIDSVELSHKFLRMAHEFTKTFATWDE